VAALVYLLSKYKPASLAADLHALTAPILVVAFLALVANAVLASLRFKVIAEDMGHKVPFREAMRTVSASGLAGAVFFSFGRTTYSPRRNYESQRSIIRKRRHNNSL
jgi:hypothetical protein